MKHSYRSVVKTNESRSETISICHSLNTDQTFSPHSVSLTMRPGPKQKQGVVWWQRKAAKGSGSASGEITRYVMSARAKVHLAYPGYTSVRRVHTVRVEGKRAGSWPGVGGGGSKTKGKEATREENPVT